MNYFELFEIPIQLQVDTTELKRKYFELSRKFHPDHNVNSQQDIALLEKSAMLNKAWTTFQSKEETLKYVLQLHNSITPEEKYALDNSFLMEIMELKETQMEAAMEEDVEKLQTIKQSFERINVALDAQLDYCNTHFAINGITDHLLNTLKDIYYKRKYLYKNE
jgi:molecular chaperone HscB